ncbi:MAG: PD-(D/E)XK nuclease family transposase [Lachnospiraceae bacterium]|nr:PD-(D/E)XK nuclease family transposase [Lachnospiraceae bacterium]
MEDNRMNIEEQLFESGLSEERRQWHREVSSGERLADIYYDTIAKHVFSPDMFPERMDFILHRTMRDQSISVEHSAANETYLQNVYAKRTISDLPAWLKDHRLVDIEIQRIAQEYVFDRAEIYASNMLLLQYSVEEGKPKSSLNYENINNAIIIVMMVNSPRIFKEFRSDRYIHRITTAIADSGIEFSMRKHIVFVQLDKALELYLNDTYNEDEDVELLKMFSLIADINNEKVIKETRGNELFDGIREDVYRFTRSLEVQQMILAEDLAMLDWNSYKEQSKREGRQEGIQEGRQEGIREGRREGKQEVNDLYRWLLEHGREQDIKKAISDNEYMEKLTEEYRAYLSSST